MGETCDGEVVSDDNKESDLAAWMREEALNLDKMFSGTPRLDFAEWKRQRDERAHIVPDPELCGRCKLLRAHALSEGKAGFALCDGCLEAMDR